MEAWGARVVGIVAAAAGVRCGCCGEAEALPRAPPEHAGLGRRIRAALCETCLRDWPPASAALTDGFLWPYAGTLRRLVVQAKEHRGPAFRLLAWAAEERLRSLAALDADLHGACWLTVPPSGRRRLRDWYLPAALGPVAARATAGGWRPLLRRRRRRPAQASLDGEARRANLQGSFFLRGRLPAGATWILDDVRTTGASLEEARRAVRERTGREVRLLAVAGVA
jgi:predicted amidophosphoribosyltransferase